MRRGAGVPPAVARASCPCRFTAKPVLSGVKEWPFHNSQADKADGLRRLSNGIK